MNASSPLLERLFSAESLEQLLARHYPAVSRELPGRLSLGEMTFTAVRLLGQHGEITQDLFALLLAERPKQRKPIRAQASQWPGYSPEFGQRDRATTPPRHCPAPQSNERTYPPLRIAHPRSQFHRATT